jgi:hypothetical protein
MKLYPKKLRSIEDLERERKVLLRECRQLDKEEFLSPGKKSNGDSKKTNNEEGSLLDLLPISNPLVSQLLKMVWRLFSKKENNPAPIDKPYIPDKKQNKNRIKSFAIEFIGGYLKWKAIELSYKAIRHIISTRKVKKNKLPR